MKKRTPEEHRQWLIEQAESCLRDAGVKIDGLVSKSLEKSTSEYMAVVERLKARKETD
jgi:hypothetical protein